MCGLAYPSCSHLPVVLILSVVVHCFYPGSVFNQCLNGANVRLMPYKAAKMRFFCGFWVARCRQVLFFDEINIGVGQQTGAHGGIAGLRASSSRRRLTSIVASYCLKIMTADLPPKAPEPWILYRCCGRACAAKKTVYNHKHCMNNQ
jgi:hypothetical protein